MCGSDSSVIGSDEAMITCGICTAKLPVSLAFTRRNFFNAERSENHPTLIIIVLSSLDSITVDSAPHNNAPYNAYPRNKTRPTDSSAHPLLPRKSHRPLRTAQECRLSPQKRHRRRNRLVRPSPSPPVRSDSPILTSFAE